jgi:hypothetical protein
MSIKELINICDVMVESNVNSESVEVATMLGNILEHIERFLYEVDYGTVIYPVEYLNRDEEARDLALEAFGEILEEMDDYICD